MLGAVNTKTGNLHPKKGFSVGKLYMSDYTATE